MTFHRRPSPNRNTNIAKRRSPYSTLFLPLILIHLDKVACFTSPSKNGVSLSSSSSNLLQKTRIHERKETKSADLIPPHEPTVPKPIQPPEIPSKRLYLINSPGMLLKTLSLTISFFFFHFLTIKISPRFKHVSPLVMIPMALGPKATCHSDAFSAFFLPLLSGTCCGIQLVMNAFLSGGGCAGFNTVLGPFRPVFLALTLYSTIMTVMTLSVSPTRALLVRYAGVVPLSWGLALLPELVNVWNTRYKPRRSSPPSGLLVKEGIDTTTNANPQQISILSLDIPSMGCVACIQKVTSSIRSSSNNVISADSWLEDDTKGGKAVVTVTSSSPEEIEKVVDAVVGAVRKVGFEGCEVLSIGEKK